MGTNYYPGEIPEAVRATIPNFRTPIKINKNYTPDQQGQDIRAEDVVRPVNHKMAGPDEVTTWRALSADRAPTYGSCANCFRSGPIARLCNNCNEDNVTLNKNGLHYEILQTRFENGKSAALDSITLSEIFRAGHETARADRDVLWLRTPVRSYSRIMLDNYLYRVFKQELEDNAANAAEHARILREVTKMTELEE